MYAAHPMVLRFLTPRVGIGPLCPTSLRVARIEDWQLPTSELRNLVETYKDILEEKFLGPVLAVAADSATEVYCTFFILMLDLHE